MANEQPISRNNLGQSKQRHNIISLIYAFDFQRFIFLYLKEKAEANPLVVSDISPLLRVDSLVNTRMGDIDTYSLPEGTRNCVGWVNPAVSVQDILWDVFRVNAVYGIANVLAGCHYERKRQ